MDSNFFDTDRKEINFDLNTHVGDVHTYHNLVIYFGDCFFQGVFYTSKLLDWSFYLRWSPIENTNLTLSGLIWDLCLVITTPWAHFHFRFYHRRSRTIEARK